MKKPMLRPHIEHLRHPRNDDVEGFVLCTLVASVVQRVSEGALRHQASEEVGKKHKDIFPCDAFLDSWIKAI